MSVPALGIDLGTTYSMAALVKDGKNQVLENADISTRMPSLIAFTPNEVLVGNEAEQVRFVHPEQCFFSFKRLMGKPALGTAKEELDQQLTGLPFRVAATEDGSVLMRAGTLSFTPEQASAELLRKIKTTAESLLECAVSQAVITVPAHFDDTQRQSTKHAAELAGLEVLRIINEPTAAAIAYGLDQGSSSTVLVYDFGGGTLDVSVLKLRDGLFKTIATSGDNALGGDDLDALIVEWIKSQIGTEEVASDAHTKQYLRVVAEEMKRELSAALEVKRAVQLPGSSLEHQITLDRSQFAALAEGLITRSLQCVQEALQGAGLQTSQIDEVVLVGGSSQIPAVRQAITDFFGRPPHVRLNPDTAIALGAAAQAHMLSGEQGTGNERKFLLMDIIPLSLGIETISGTFSKLILKNASLPARVSETFSTSKDGQSVVRINIYQGEREFVKDCRLIGTFALRGIPPMPAGLPRIEVGFSVDANGILTVSARELRSGAAESIEVIPEHGLKKTMVDTMLLDSFRFAEEDYKARNLADFRSTAENMIQGFRRSQDRLDEFFSAEQKALVLQAYQDLQDMLGQDDPSALKQAIDEFGALIRDYADYLISTAAKRSLQEVYQQQLHQQETDTT